METVGILGRQSRQWTPSLFGIRITSAGLTEGLGTALQRERTQQLCSHGPVGGYRVWTSLGSWWVQEKEMRSVGESK